ncbi:hypothetical protein VPFG_00161 [Vibrio phage nt-1]|uniref:Uncharacterized protein n=1 Tax=Vibrio phage nt-1 TaxID=115992 RepID=R9TGE1_9CAUD|nr:hypothetical protein VPFG_00161 [Vibrio phage nt-1]AGN30163.1 hypothetical protein VPFG_00161 [Vibrio phage nt-1]
MRRQIKKIQSDNNNFKKYMRLKAARSARREIIHHIAHNKTKFLIGSYTMYERSDLKVVKQLMRYAGFENAHVEAVPIVGTLVDCTNVIHSIGFQVDLGSAK